MLILQFYREHLPYLLHQRLLARALPPHLEPQRPPPRHRPLLQRPRPPQPTPLPRQQHSHFLERGCRFCPLVWVYSLVSLLLLSLLLVLSRTSVQNTAR